MISRCHAFAQPSFKQLEREAGNQGTLSIANPGKEILSTCHMLSMSLFQGQEINSDKEERTYSIAQALADLRAHRGACICDSYKPTGAVGAIPSSATRAERPPQLSSARFQNAQ